MNSRQLAIVLVVAAFALPLLKKLWEVSQANTGADLPKGKPSQVVEYVKKTLHDHEGEDTPLVHAFEAALEQQRQVEPSRA